MILLEKQIVNGEDVMIDTETGLPATQEQIAEFEKGSTEDSVVGDATTDEHPDLKKDLENVAPDKFDFNEYRNQTTVKAIEAFYMLIGENASALANISMEGASNEDIINFVDKMSRATMKICIENKVPDADMKWMMDKVADNTFAIFTAMSRQKNELEKEFLARTLGARNPGDGKLSREYATLETLFTQLQAVREEQDVKGNQYFHVDGE